MIDWSTFSLCASLQPQQSLIARSLSPWCSSSLALAGRCDRRKHSVPVQHHGAAERLGSLAAFLTSASHSALQAPPPPATPPAVRQRSQVVALTPGPASQERRELFLLRSKWLRKEGGVLSTSCERNTALRTTGTRQREKEGERERERGRVTHTTCSDTSPPPQ